MGALARHRHSDTNSFLLGENTLLFLTVSFRLTQLLAYIILAENIQSAQFHRKRCSGLCKPFLVAPPTPYFKVNERLYTCVIKILSGLVQVGAAKQLLTSRKLLLPLLLSFPVHSYGNISQLVRNPAPGRGKSKKRSPASPAACHYVISNAQEMNNHLALTGTSRNALSSFQPPKKSGSAEG